MTTNEFRLKFNQFKIEAYNYIKASSPYRTGALRNAIKFNETKDGFEIIIDIDYMKYTEEAWTFNSRWNKTLRNPNYKWLQESVYNLALRFANTLQGVVVR